jgi:hypothetical protein
MEPLEPNDPLWNLLGRSRPLEPRGNFCQNVLREARQTPQDVGFWARLRAWAQGSPSLLPRLALGSACALLLAFGLSTQFSPRDPISITSPPAPAPSNVEDIPLLGVETQLESMDEVSALLALEDTSSFSDSEINFLLY